jgi:hypothetical protein
MRVPGAFSADAAAAMRDATWRELAKAGIRRDDRSTWKAERPAHLQRLKAQEAFQAIGSPRTIAAIDEVLDGQPWQRPGDWGGAFLLFPGEGAWVLPWKGWHLDGRYDGRLEPPCGVKVHAMFGDVVPGAGGMLILSGSHRLVYNWFKKNPPSPKARSLEMRASLNGQPYIRALCSNGDAEARCARFWEQSEEVEGIELQVIENCAVAGDVILMHSLLLHTAPTVNAGTEPRFLLNKDIVV